MERGKDPAGAHYFVNSSKQPLIGLVVIIDMGKNISPVKVIFVVTPFVPSFPLAFIMHKYIQRLLFAVRAGEVQFAVCDADGMKVDDSSD